MKQNLRNVIFVWLFVLSVVCNARAEPIPNYGGRPIGFWLSHLAFSAVDRDGKDIEKGFPEKYRTIEDAERHQKTVKEFREKAPIAVRSIGTNALPYIFQMLTFKGGEIPKFLLSEDDGIERESSPRVVRGRAIVALEALRAHRAVIEPALKEMLKNQSNLDVKGAIVASLKGLLPPRKSS